MLLFGMDKTRTNPIATLRRLRSDQRRLLVRAAFVLSGASTAVALLPFRKAIRFGCVSARGTSGLSVPDCVWAVEAAARRLPWRTMCIEQGLAAQRLLRGRGVDAVLHYGARREPERGKLEAHVWVTVGGQAVIGGEQAPDFAEIASYP
jgi:hypothetical protein